MSTPRSDRIGAERAACGEALSRAWPLLVAAAYVAAGCGADRTATPTAGSPSSTSHAAPDTGASARANPSASASTARSEPAPGTHFAAQALVAHVNALAAPELGGRKAGSADEAKARAYIAAALERFGVAAPPPAQVSAVFAPGAADAGVAPPAEPLDPSGRTFAFVPTGGWESVPGVSGNVYGLVRGARADEFLVVGAHLDHVGSIDGALYPGAEDNASGVALLLELARALQAYAANPAAAPDARLERSVVFAFFGSEEIGLLGSRAYVRTPPVPLAQTFVMVNVDMIGRPLADQAGLSLAMLPFGIDPERSVGIIGTEGRPAMRALVDTACRGAGIRAVAPEDFPAMIRDLLNRMAKGRGDNASFERAGIPSVFFSSGESDDYHKPTDVPERIDGAIMAARAEAIYATVLGLARAGREGLRNP